MTAPVNLWTRMISGDVTVTSLNHVAIGTPSDPVGSVEELAHQLKITQCEKNCNLVIYGCDVLYGGDLEIIKDPGILAINPMKLILVGAYIAQSDEGDNLEQLMMSSNWNYDLYERLEVTEVASVQVALMKPAKREYLTLNPLRMVYSIKT